MSKHQRIVIVGAGQAGGVAAVALRNEGFAGAITLIGKEVWPPYERPPLSKDLLRGDMAVERAFLRPAEAYAQQSIDLLLTTTAEEIDRGRQRLTLSDGTSIAYDALLLATGMRPRPLEVPQLGGPKTHYLRDLDDCFDLRRQFAPNRRVVVIGAGLIGLEVAATARKAGCDVVILGQKRHPMPRVVPADVGRILTVLHCRHGVEFRGETVIESIEGRDEGSVILAQDGQEIFADTVVVGIGGLPNTQLAESAGLAVANGIITDEFGRTSDPAIFAAGDVARRYSPRLGRHVCPESWQNAQNQAMAVARTLVGHPEPYDEVPWFWTDQYDLNLQGAGGTEGYDRLVWRGEPGIAGSCLFYLSNGCVIGGACFNNGRDMRHVKQLVARGLAPKAERLADTNVRLADLCH